MHFLLTDPDVKPYTMIVAGIVFVLCSIDALRIAWRPIENFGEKLPAKTAVADEHEGDQCA